MDIDGLKRLLRALESGEVRVTARELALPSPFAMEI
jgi:Lhr-like helicase